MPGRGNPPTLPKEPAERDICQKAEEPREAKVQEDKSLTDADDADVYYEVPACETKGTEAGKWHLSPQALEGPVGPSS